MNEEQRIVELERQVATLEARIAALELKLMPLSWQYIRTADEAEPTVTYTKWQYNPDTGEYESMPYVPE